jgi:hypothetical protein
VSRLHPFRTRRTFAAGLGVLLAGALAIPSPAQAAQTELSGSCGWDSAASVWVVTWTISPAAPEGASGYGLADLEAAPAGSEPEGLAGGAESLHPAGEPLVAEQRVPEEETAASLSMLVAWDTGQQEPLTAELAIPADCQGAEAPDLIQDTALSCTGLTIAIENSSDDPTTLRFVPSLGDPLTVEVAGGQSTIVEFPASPGLSVDVLFEGRSIVDASEPIEVLLAEWEALRCDEDDEGEGGGLPATGLSITIAVVGALILLGVGTGLYLAARRRRIHFTA